MSAAAVLAGEARWHVERAEALAFLRTLPDACVDAVVTDPPYELGFMGKAWDASGIANNVDLWREALRVLRPGGHLLAFGGTRTAHRMVCAIEDAGFEIRDSIVWLYGSGFPKSLDVSKAIDKAAGAERKVVGSRRLTGTARIVGGQGGATSGRSAEMYQTHATRDTLDLTAPATPLAEQWSGWGTALKPAHEPVCVARKPLVGTVAANVAEYGTGAINVDACRIGVNGGTAKGSFPNGASVSAYGNGLNGACEIVDIGAGRWPANVTLSHLPECREVGVREVVQRPTTWPNAVATRSSVALGRMASHEAKTPQARGASVVETVPAFDCAPGCAVAALDEQSDGSSRFYYVAKASRAERNAGCEGLPETTPSAYAGAPLNNAEHECSDGVHRTGKREPRANHHPTVKPIALMRWLVRLVTPPGGVVLDPFNGSGSTGCACALEGLRYAGIEREAEYVEIARARIAHWEAQAAAPAKPRRAPKPRPAPPPPSLPRPVADERQIDLFDRRTA